MSAGGIQTHHRLAVLEEYERVRPSEGREYHQWVDATAAKLGMSKSAVGRVIAEEQEIYLQTFRSQAQSNAQRIAQFVGATQAAAYQTLADGLKATKKSPVLDRGKPVTDPATGDFV